jgi:hypothetical protein
MSGLYTTYRAQTGQWDDGTTTCVHTAEAAGPVRLFLH